MAQPAKPARYPSLEGRVVLVTGGGSGIGAAMVEGFAGNGARVAFLDIDTVASEALAASLKGTLHPPLFIACDLVDIEALRGAVDRVRAEFGPVSVLVNNAANDERHDLDALTVDYWDRAQAVNLRHQLFAAQAVRPQMRELGGGSIINLTSIAWMRGTVRMIAYTTAKAAVVGLTNSLAQELGPENIRVNAIAPGAVITERQLRLWHSEEQVELFVARQCLKRRLLARDVAAMTLFLAADDSAMITKQTFIVDAGLL